MAASRQPQILTHFLRAVRSCKPNTYRSIKGRSSPRSQFHTNARRQQTTYPNRYGPAATEGLPPPPKPTGALAPKKEDQTNSEPQQAQSKQGVKQLQEQSQKKEEKPLEQQDFKSESTEKDAPIVDKEKGSTLLEQASAAVQMKQKDAEVKGDTVTPEPDSKQELSHKELDMVLATPAPSELQGQGGKPRHPHLEPSPYEHHFDTYSLVQELARDPDTFTEEQAITAMKAVRLMLSDNLELAKEGLVSKSDVENESYLFRAACSELRTTLQSTRAAENQRQRTQRAQLQHEMDILSQKVTQDIQSLREDMKGLFNDRKMGLQEEKRKIDSKISELNYEITVLLNSEAKSEVEGLRWVLTRRAALAIATAAFMTLTSLQYYSVKSREAAEIEKKRAAAQKAQQEMMASESQARYTTPSRSSGTQTGMAEYEESLG